MAAEIETAAGQGPTSMKSTTCPRPVFNLADSAIVVGAILLAWTGMRARREPAVDRPGADGA